MLKPEYQKILVDIINKHLSNCRIYLYGSRARGDNQIGSDIDLALDMDKPIDWGVLGNIREDITESTVPLFVDIVDVQASDQEFLDEIKKEWIQIF